MHPFLEDVALVHLYLLMCRVRVTVGDLGLHRCAQEKIA